ncbi:histidine kinase N-terminal 7TM domain-containing protein [Halorientalis regularis]|uniref:histidine kinase n=1 Tax=Halorientalis regularis TaxID=660518 RepID=A0A1G7P7X4_9EURY|nr:histidine kinase N-terminal 7TM domain-containing protein [Halorientalis regularis]SDF82368.1 PAS domain S-box-containing protein [Halorientalis regularis]
MFQYSIYVPALLLVAGISAVAAYLGYVKRDRRGTVWYAGSMAAIATWSLFLALTVASTSYRLKLVFFAGFLVSSVALCSCWFLFAVAYTGHYDRLPRYLPHALLTVPLVYVPATLTSAVDDLVIVNPRLVTEGGTVLLTYDAWGPIAWGFILFTYTLLVAATVLLFRKALHSRNVYRKLSLVLGFGGLSMWTTNMITVAGFSPFPHMMLVPFSFLFWGAVALVLFTSIRFVQMIPVNAILARFSSRFDDVLPLARDFVIEEIDSGVIIMDDDARIVDINSTARKMLGLDERVVGKQVHTVVDIGQYFDDYETGERVGNHREQVWISTENGEYCYDINVSEIVNDGEVVGRSVMIYDITEQKEREEQLREREEELRQQKQDLERQKQQLEHQNERLDRFASIVSHDLRNPLNVATGHVELLEARLDAEHRESVEELDTAHERMRDIIDDALTLARSGKAITEKEDVDVGSVATEAWENVDTDRATLEADIDLRLESDRDRLLNVFENLYRNALDHNDGDLTIRVGTLADDTGFYVEDTGDGIPEDERDEVLEQGYTTHEEGTGLGLAIVRDIVGAHGWELSITESPEGGARFEIECFREPVEVETAAA